MFVPPYLDVSDSRITPAFPAPFDFDMFKLCCNATPSISPPLVRSRRVDKERVELVGPDCACAEWLLRNGASVRFKGHPELLSDYNALISLEESPELKHLKIEDIYAREAALNSWGFDHLKNCHDVKKITLIFCNRVTDLALFKLGHVKESLEYLEITSCFNVKDQGVKSLGQLRNLTVLKLVDLVSVKNLEDCEVTLRKELPNCRIDAKK